MVAGKSLKAKLAHIEKSIVVCKNCGFSTKKLMSAWSQYIEFIKKPKQGKRG